MWFIIVNIAFFISPAYWVPPMITSPLSRARITKTPELIPSLLGLAFREGAWRMVYSGACLSSSSSEALTNMLCMKAACHAFSVTSLTGILCLVSAPQKASLTNKSSVLSRCFLVLSRSLSNFSGDIGLLTSPHHTSSARPGSSTMKRSLGDLPVLSPVVVRSTPCEVSFASFLETASSCSFSQPRFQCTLPLGFSPWSANVVRGAVLESDMARSSMHFD